MQHLLRRPRVWFAGFLLALAFAGSAVAQGHSARVIVAFKPGSVPLREAALARTGAAEIEHLQRRADALAARAGVALAGGRAVGPRAQVVRASGIDAATLAARLAAHPDVAWAVPDRRRRALFVPTDPLYRQAVRADGPDAGQWYLRAPNATYRSAVNAQAAWDRTTGNPEVVVAVLDTGVLASHLDLDGRVLPGIDTIEDLDIANDGSGADTNASDPGDWISAAEDRAGPLAGCGESDSSWHGTMVASLIGAAANDGIGMAGTASGVRILPVRVLGKCGGYDSDIIAGMYWAVGLQRIANRINNRPARVLNLSLGSEGACEPSYRDAIADVNATGAVVVAAAGNSAGHAVGTPANCPGMIAVAALRHAGSKVGFSDLGPEITISAPGGNCVNVDGINPCLYPILAATNSGTRGPLAGGSTWTDSYNVSVGTSFAAPIVAGTAALMLSARPALTPDEVRQALQTTARAFPTDGADNGPSDPTPVRMCRAPTSTDQLQCYCTTALCGAGMVDARAAVAAVSGLIARIAVGPSAPLVGDTLVLDAGGTLTASGRSVTGYQWTIVDGAGAVSGFAGADNAQTATLLPTADGEIVVRLTVVDDGGAQSTVETVIAVAAVPGTGGPGGGSGGGGSSGGGGLDGLALLGLAAALAALGSARRPRGTR